MLNRFARRSLIATLAFPIGALAVQAATLHTAHATTGPVTLNLPFDEQQNTNWCWLAAAESILSFYGSTVPQCQLANEALSVTDCCTSPTPSTCNVGGSTQKPMGYYGVGFTQVTQLTFAQFEAQIAAGNPVSIGVSWDSSGGHAMNVAGTNASTSSLYVYDPDSGAFCPGGESECWVTYAAYLGGAGYTYTAQIPLSNLGWSPVCASDYADLSGAAFQQCEDQWTHHGRIPTALSSTSSGSNVVYAGSYQPSTSAWFQYGGQTQSQYQSTATSLFAQGYRTSQVTVTSTPSGFLFNTIYQVAEGTFSSAANLSQAEFASQNGTLGGEGYVLEDLFGYSDSTSTPSFAATWVKTTSNGQFASIDVPASQLQALFDEQSSYGRRFARISAYDNGGVTNYAVLWQNAGGLASHSMFGDSESQFLASDATLNADGLTLKYVSALGNVFSAVWSQ